MPVRQPPASGIWAQMSLCNVTLLPQLPARRRQKNFVDEIARKKTNPGETVASAAAANAPNVPNWRRRQTKQPYHSDPKNHRNQSDGEHASAGFAIEERIDRGCDQACIVERWSVIVSRVVMVVAVRNRLVMNSPFTPSSWCRTFAVSSKSRTNAAPARSATQDHCHVSQLPERCWLQEGLRFSGLRRGLAAPCVSSLSR